MNFHSGPFRGFSVARIPSSLVRVVLSCSASFGSSWFVSAAVAGLVACRPAVPLVGFENQDFQARSIQESSDRIWLNGQVLIQCEASLRSLSRLEVRLLESGIEEPRQVVSLDFDGRFALRTTRSAIDGGRMMIEVAGRVRVVTPRDISQGLVVVLPCLRE